MKNQLQKPIETEIKDRKFKVNDDGSIDMVETLENRVSLTGREFITVVREHEEAIKNMRYNLSDEFKKLTLFNFSLFFVINSSMEDFTALKFFSDTRPNLKILSWM